MTDATSQPAQAILSLATDDAENLDRGRSWVKDHFTHDSDAKYESIDGKLRVVDAILAQSWVARAETEKLQSLGVAFGDAVAQELLLEWVVVDDEYGRSPALRWPGTSIICSPLTMISKRVEAGETVDVYDLFRGICSRLREMAFSGDFT